MTCTVDFYCHESDRPPRRSRTRSIASPSRCHFAATLRGTVRYQAEQGGVQSAEITPSWRYR